MKLRFEHDGTGLRGEDYKDYPRVTSVEVTMYEHTAAMQGDAWIVWDWNNDPITVNGFAAACFFAAQVANHHLRGGVILTHVAGEHVPEVGGFDAVLRLGRRWMDGEFE